MEHTMSDADELGPKSTTIDWGESRITLTVDDAKAMNTALLTYLNAADPSQLPDRDYLIQWSQGPAWIDVEGVVRINVWVLQSEAEGLVLNCRMPTAEGARDRKEYVAPVVRDDVWRVTNVRAKYVHLRR
jgi:hypothetical protein